MKQPTFIYSELKKFEECRGVKNLLYDFRNET